MAVNETPEGEGDRRGRIERKLRDGLQASYVEVVDESHLHAGHAGARSGGGHYRATIVSDEFDGLSSVAAQRKVYALLSDEMGGEIHALSMKTLTPGQWKTEA
jgi:BolA protein